MQRQRFQGILGVSQNVVWTEDDEPRQRRRVESYKGAQHLNILQNQKNTPSFLIVLGAPLNAKELQKGCVVRLL